MKTKVALAAIKGDKTLAELSAQYQVHQSQILAWKPQLQQRAVEVCSHFVTPSNGGHRMNISRSLIAITAANVVLVVISVGQNLRPAFAAGDPPVLRGQALEIVDGQGRVRASINVVPSGRSANGDEYPETVLLRLNTERGRPSVKISSSEPASGLSFAGPTNTKDTYVILQAKGTISSLKLRNEDGREQIVAPQ